MLAWARLLAGVILAGLSAPLAAQEFSAPITPVLTLESERLLSETLSGQRVSAGIEDAIAALAAENRRIEAELEAEERDLTDRRPGLEPAAFRALADAFDTKVQRIRGEQDAKQRELQRRQEAEQQAFLTQVTPIISEIANRYGALVILERRSIVLGADGIDITDEAIARINAVLGDGSGSEGRTEGPADTTGGR